MYPELYENKQHGTEDFPYVEYHLNQIPHAFQIPVHWHHELEIIYVKKGPLELSISGKNYVANTGDVYFVNTGELHLYRSEDGNVNYHTFVFPLSFISFQSDDYLEKHYFSPLRSQKLRIQRRLPKDQEPKAVSLCERLIVASKNESHQQIGTRIVLLEIMQLLMDCDMFVPMSNHQNSMDKELISYIQQNYTGSLSLLELATHFHLSEKYISRYFKVHFQMTLSSYIMHLRLSHARQLLDTTELPITEVALQSGFNNVSYFIRTFKENYQTSPLQYRNTAS